MRLAPATRYVSPASSPAAAIPDTPNLRAARTRDQTFNQNSIDTASSVRRGRPLITERLAWPDQRRRSSAGYPGGWQNTPDTRRGNLGVAALPNRMAAKKPRGTEVEASLVSLPQAKRWFLC